MGSISQVRKPPHSKTFGVELECYPPTRYYWGTHLWRNYGKKSEGFFEITSDMSLANGGVEFVSQPMPYVMLKKQLIVLHKRIGGWVTDSNCGLHIHVSRQYWSAQREEKFSEFLKRLTNTQIIELFGRRAYFAEPHAYRDDKYRAVNLLHPHTYEFRLWKAGDIHWTLEALRRTKLIVEYRGKWTYENCLELFTKPSEEKPTTPLVNTFKQIVNPTAHPAVRRVRRQPV